MIEEAKCTHPWDVSPKEAAAIQNDLRQAVIREDRLEEPHRVAGIDVGFEAGGKTARAAVVVLSFPELVVLETSMRRRVVGFPYVPGLLSFREAPVILEALASLRNPPELLMVDGQGLAHPRRFGLACHLGVLSGCASVGIAKSRLVGEHASLGEERGDWQPLVDRAEVVGAALRTRAGSKPVFVSIGHNVTLETAIELVMRCTTKYRLPEATRLAHNLASRQ